MEVVLTSNGTFGPDYLSTDKDHNGKSTIKTLTGYVNKTYGFVTLIGHPSQIGKKFTIASITFINSEGHLISCANVKGYVHHTLPSFNSVAAKNGQLFGVVASKDAGIELINRQPFNMTKVEFTEGWAGGPPKAVEPDVAVKDPVVEKSTDLPWMKTAKSLLGIKEIPGAANNKAIIGWAKEIGKPVSSIYTADSIAWCGLFTSYVVFKNGMKPVDEPLWALNWAHFGLKLDTPAYGAIMVFKRSGGGHVGFYISEDADSYHILGGNQTDMVCVKKVAKAQCVGIRWPLGKEKLLVPGRIKKVLAGPITTSANLA